MSQPVHLSLPARVSIHHADFFCAAREARAHLRWAAQKKQASMLKLYTGENTANVEKVRH